MDATRVYFISFIIVNATEQDINLLPELLSSAEAGGTRASYWKNLQHNKVIIFEI